MNTKNWYYK